MKKAALYIVFLMLSQSVFSQNLLQGKKLYFPPNIPASNYTYQARDGIYITQGSFMGDNTDFVINPHLAFPADYLAGTEIKNPASRTDFTTKNEVGTLPGGGSVSPTGAAGYSIPIQVPPGTAGMVPSVSVSYNSQGGTGLLGKGWNLGAVSVITRTGSTPYHDGKIRPIAFNANDNFVWDGQRLIKSTTANTYYTEIESFATITPSGNINGGPATFTVVTSTGTQLTYGATASARMQPSSSRPVMVWYITRTEDQLGNYITYTYDKTSNGEVYLKTIDYTGNSNVGLAPYNKVSFFYDTRTDKQVGFIRGEELHSELLLNRIKTYSEGSPVKEYKFEYYFDEFTHLNTITEYNAEGDQYNSTVVGWGNKTTIGEAAFSIPGGTALKDIFYGEFNGDGKRDMFTIRKYAFSEYSNWELYLSNGSNYSKVSSDDYLYGETTIIFDDGRIDADRIIIADVTGDGIDEIIAKDYRKEGADNYDTDYYIFEVNQSNFSLQENTALFRSLNDKTFSELFGDIDGDGINEMFYMAVDVDVINDEWWNIKEDKVNVDVYCRVVSFTGNTSDFSAVESSCAEAKIYLFDFNGDGRMNPIINKGGSFADASSLKVFGYSGNVFTRICTYPIITFPGVHSKSYYGDFNGDGITDIFNSERRTIGAPVQKLRLGTGEGWSEDGLMDLPVTINVHDDDIRTLVADANGDGLSDIIQLKTNRTGTFGNYSYNTDIIICYSTGTGFTKQTYNKSDWNGNFDSENGGNFIDVIDYDGDGRLELTYRGGAATINAFKFNPNDQSSLVTHISNGLKHSTRFTYSTLAKEDCYTREGVSTNNTIVNLCAPVWVVKQMQGNNGLGTAMNTVSYSYEGAKVHKFGKGFLGFTAMEVHDQTTNVTTRSVNELNTTYYVMQPKSSTVTVGTTQISSTTNTNGVHLYSGIRILPYTNRVEAIDAINNNTTVKTNNFNFTYGYLNWEEELYDNGTRIRNAYTRSLINGVWRIKTHTVTNTRNGESETRSSSNSYYGNGTVQSTTSNLGIQKSFTYDGCGNQKSTTLSYTGGGLPSRTSTVSYDDTYRFVTSKSNTLGHTAYFEYDGRFGVVTKKTDANGLITQNEYDGFGRLVRTTSPAGLVTNSLIDWDDSYTNALYRKEVSGTGMPNTTEYFDLLGRSVHATTTGWNNTLIHTSTQYYASGKVYRESEPYTSGETIRYTTYNYNSLQQLSTSTTPTCSYSYNYPDNAVSVTDCQGRTKTTVSNPDGTTHSVTDEGGTITYTYNALGKVTEINTGGIVTTIGYDDFGNQTSLDDPDAGLMTYQYNAYGELEWQENARGQRTSYTYDALGRTLSETSPDLANTYVYDTRKLGMLTSVSGINTTTSYTYDTYARVSTKTKQFDGQSYTFSYTYDNNTGKLSSTTYPSGFIAQNHYNSDNGILTFVSRNDNASWFELWRCNNMNKFGQVTNFVQGNNIETTNQYDEYGFPVQKETSYNVPNMSVPYNLSYSFNRATGNLSSRSLFNGVTKQEMFGYDELDRLVRITYNGVDNEIQYSDNGNILSKYDAGYQYDYDAANKPHAVREVYNHAPSISQTRQDIVYNSYEQPVLITQGTKTLEITYDDATQNRIKSVYNNTATGENWERIYLGDYEIVKAVNQPTRHLCYFAGGVNLQYEGGTRMNYYFTTDYLGSVLLITNQEGEKVRENSYDAWGRARNTSNWGYSGAYNPSYSMEFFRGYTGHEHLDEFGLINMNGRLYDPQLGRMLSPDNYVQSASSTQSFNRYSYCFNNPLKYTDPSGEFLTWSLSKNSFSFGVNLTPIGIPLGGGWNIGWGGGLSFGRYTEVGYRVGSVGATASQSLDYNYRHQSWSTTTSVSASASFGPFYAGANVSFTYNITNGEWSNGWGISAGAGLSSSDGSSGIGLSVGYGSGGFNIGLGGYHTGLKPEVGNVNVPSGVMLAQNDVYNNNPNGAIPDVTPINYLLPVDDASSQGGENSSDRNFVEKTSDFLSSNGYYFGTSIAGIGLDYSGTGKYLNYAKVGVKYAGHLGTGVSVISNTKDVVQGEITPGRYSYRMTGTGLTILAGASSGGLGLLVGGCVIGAEYTWDNYLVPLGQEIQYQFYMFEQSLKPSNWIK